MSVEQLETIGKKLDNDKVRYDLVDVEFEESIAKVLTFGAKKYAPNNWRKLENPIERYYAALRRHIAAWRKGERNDRESGLHHLAHAAVNAMFLIALEDKIKLEVTDGTEKSAQQELETST